jgi:hypothetical protein
MWCVKTAFDFLLSFQRYWKPATCKWGYIHHPVQCCFLINQKCRLLPPPRHSQENGRQWTRHPITSESSTFCTHHATAPVRQVRRIPACHGTNCYVMTCGDHVTSQSWHPEVTHQHRNRTVGATYRKLHVQPIHSRKCWRAAYVATSYEKEYVDWHKKNLNGETYTTGLGVTSW